MTIHQNWSSHDSSLSFINWSRVEGLHVQGSNIQLRSSINTLLSMEEEMILSIRISTTLLSMICAYMILVNWNRLIIPELNKWDIVALYGFHPLSRFGQSMVTVKDQILVFGGKHLGYYCSANVHVLEVGKWPYLKSLDQDIVHDLVKEYDMFKGVVNDVASNKHKTSLN